MRKIAQCQERAARHFNLYVPDPRPEQLASLLLDHQLAPIRDEDAMAGASEEDKEICRRAWASIARLRQGA